VTLSTVEVTMLENNIVVYKFVQDLHFFVTGGEEENEVILATVLQGFFDAVGLLLRFLLCHFIPCSSINFYAVSTNCHPFCYLIQYPF
jgi:hypothetical protein